MGGLLMVRVLGFVRDGLSGGEPTDDQNSNHKQNGERSSGVKVVHALS
jgi:hypothetical protein